MASIIPCNKRAQQKDLAQKDNTPNFTIERT